MSSLLFNGIAYTGETGRNKKEAEQLAARAVIRSLLGISGYATVLSEIIKSKTKLYAALNKVKDSKYSTQNISTSDVPTAAIFEVRAGLRPTAMNFEPSTGMHPLHAIAVVSSGMHPTAAVAEASAGLHITIPWASVGMHPTAAAPEAKPKPSSGTINLPVSFAHPGLGQPSVGPNSTNKRRKSKRKANKKLCTDAQLCVAAQPLAQALPFSVAQ